MSFWKSIHKKTFNNILWASIAGMLTLQIVLLLTKTLSLGYLPEPFIYDKRDALMDLYNTQCWSNEGGFYTSWGSVYPALVFFVLRLVSPKNGCPLDAFSLRDALGYESALFLLASAFSVSASLMLYSNKSQTKNWLVTYCFLFSAPSLFAMERGNLIVFMPLLLRIFISGSHGSQMLAIIAAINIKPYMAIYLLVDIIKKKYYSACLIVIGSVLLHFLACLALRQNPLSIVYNLIFFSKEDILSPAEIVSFCSSVMALSYLAEAKLKYIFWISAFTGLLKVLVSACLGFFLMYMKEPLENASRVELVALLSLAISNLIFKAGPYSLLLYIPVIFAIISSSNRPILAATLICFIFSFIDLLPLHIFNYRLQYAPLINSFTPIPMQATLGIFRPVANICLFYLFLTGLRTKYAEKI